VGVCGRESRKTMREGVLAPLRRERTQAWSSAASVGWPGRATMTAAMSWPHCSSGMPTTTALGDGGVVAGDLVAADVHVADAAGRHLGSVGRADLRLDSRQELAGGAETAPGVAAFRVAAGAPCSASCCYLSWWGSGDPVRGTGLPARLVMI
jgi:hypothetical protein